MAKRWNYVDEMASELRQIVDHAQALVNATAGEVDGRIKDARDALQERLEGLTDDYDDIRSHVLEKAEAVDEYIHERPYCAIGSALGIGLILGWLWFGGKRR